jgi:hypothetical protein
MTIDPTLVGSTLDNSDLTVYTQPVSGLYESTDPSITALAQSLTDNTPNPYYKAWQLFRYVVENIDYTAYKEPHSALWVLNAKRGDCDDFSNLFVALARAAGIPAKTVSGNVYDSTSVAAANENIENNTSHAWAIFYLPNYGWVSADAVWPLHTGSFGKIDYVHITGATVGGEGVVQGGEIKWYAPGQISTNWSYYHGSPTDISPSIESGHILPEVMLDLDTSTSSPITNDNLTFTVTVQNVGRSTATGLTASLDFDSNYFTVAGSSPQKTSLASGETWVAIFDVTLKENAYGARHVVTPTVTYSSDYTGQSSTFLAQGETSVNIAEKPATPTTVSDSMTLIALVAMVGLIVGIVAAAVARR